MKHHATSIFSRPCVFRIIAAAVTVHAALLAGLTASALPASHYAAASALAEGTWKRVSIEKEGMQFISNSTLRQMGFSDPSKVNVYGYGGEMLSETLNSSMIDDLPMQPVARTQNGIIFYGTGHVTWKRATTGAFPYSHVKNLYSETSYYFLSDRDPAVESPEPLNLPLQPSVAEITTFQAPLLHEEDLAPASNTGAIYLGEDFRTTNSRRFTFQLPDNVGSSVTARVNFAALNTATSPLTFKANGVQLPSAAGDIVSGGSSSSEIFLRRGICVKTFDCPGNKLDFEITYDYSGVLSMARLDYIELTYTRDMSLTGSELVITHNVTTPTTFAVSGLDSTSEIWDVTTPASPRKVVYSLSGNTGRFTVADTGLRRFVAFNPAKVTNAPKEFISVDNQNLHSEEAPDYLIITPAEYRAQAERLAEAHRKRGLSVLVTLPEPIYNEFSSGNPDVTAYRKLLKMWHDRGAETGKRTSYCMIFSRPTYDNKCVSTAVRNCGYPRLPMWGSPTIETESYSFSTDDYIGMLDDNNTYFDIQGANRIYVAVGRFAVCSTTEAREMVDKTISFLENPGYGAWRNNLTFIADDQNNGDHMTQSEKAIARTRAAGNGSAFNYYRLYTDSYPLVYTGTGPTYPEPKRLMFQRFNESAVISYAGHANPRSWTHESLLTWTDMNNLTNTNLPFLLAYTCEYLRWDDDEVSGAEVTWKHPSSGFIGMLVPSRTVYMNWNLTYNLAVADHMYERTADGKAKTWGQVMIDSKNERLTESGYRGNTLKYAFLGDPALPLPSPECEVRLERIGDTDLTAGIPENLPELGTRASAEIEGSITGPDGNVLTDYNGVVEITLYDAEVPVTSNGNGTDGEPVTYNDRKTKLFNTRVRAENGRWKGTLRIPMEIENNYSPALISLYAYSEDGVEANGASESLYVYGYDETAEPDTEGPEIMYLGLNNRQAFTDGTLVNPNPIVFATFRDESGINLSDAGIGHRITLTLDEKTIYDDVNQYFMADIDEEGKGSVSYPLSDIEPGSHVVKLTVWDNANNSSSATASFQVGVGVSPAIHDITTDVNPATTGVTFTVSTDYPMSRLDYTVEVFDLSGRKVWSSVNAGSTDIDSMMSVSWDLTDAGGHRVPRGIYLYRATVSTPDGMSQTKTKKLAVTAP